MGNKDEARVGPESVEAGLRAVFGDSVRAPAAGAVDDRYSVVGEIARGGVGIVLKSHDRELSRDVAVKVLRDEYASQPEVLERFVEEAQIGGQLQHPGIVPVYGLGVKDDGRPYFAMKLIQGRTLGEILDARADPKEHRRRLLGIFEQVCQTMAYAHARGVIHRDLKPNNVMIGSFGEVQVVDWGFAKVLDVDQDEKTPETPIATVRSDTDSAQSMAGSVMGTFSYMPPEQALGQVQLLDERADVFTLGGILCEILTGKPTYVAPSAELFRLAANAQLDGALKRLADCGADDDLVELTQRCLAPQADDRPRDAGEVAEAVQAHLAAVEERARRMELAAAEEHAKEVEEQARLAKQLAQAKAEEARVAKEKREAQKEQARQKEERQRAEFERKARTRSLAMAAALLVAVLLGLGGLLYSQGAAAARANDIASRVSAAMQKAAELEGRGDFSEALTWAQNAGNVAREADEPTRERVRAAERRIAKKKADAEAAAKRREADAKVLEAWRSSLYGLSWTANDATAIAHFKEQGIDLNDPDAAAARIRISEYRDELLSILDQLVQQRRIVSQLKGYDWESLFRLAKAADPDRLRSSTARRSDCCERRPARTPTRTSPTSFSRSPSRASSRCSRRRRRATRSRSRRCVPATSCSRSWPRSSRATSTWRSGPAMPCSTRTPRTSWRRAKGASR
jgi:serine/threonine-protein kinase